MKEGLVKEKRPVSEMIDASLIDEVQKEAGIQQPLKLSAADGHRE